MGIDYSPVLGVGVNQEDITYEVLTEGAKQVIRNIYINDFCGEPTDDETVYSEWFEENIYEYDLFYQLGLDCCYGNLFSGWYGKRGVSVSLEDLVRGENAVLISETAFKKVVNLKPELFHEVLVS